MEISPYGFRVYNFVYKYCRRRQTLDQVAFGVKGYEKPFENLGYMVRGPGAEEALAVWASRAPLYGLAREHVALPWARGDVVRRVVPSR